MATASVCHLSMQLRPNSQNESDLENVTRSCCPAGWALLPPKLRHRRRYNQISNCPKLCWKLLGYSSECFAKPVAGGALGEERPARNPTRCIDGAASLLGRRCTGGCCWGGHCFLHLALHVCMRPGRCRKSAQRKKNQRVDYNLMRDPILYARRSTALFFGLNVMLDSLTWNRAGASKVGIGRAVAKQVKGSSSTLPCGH